MAHGLGGLGAWTCGDELRWGGRLGGFSGLLVMLTSCFESAGFDLWTSTLPDGLVCGLDGLVNGQQNWSVLLCVEGGPDFTLCVWNLCGGTGVLCRRGSWDWLVILQSCLR